MQIRKATIRDLKTIQELRKQLLNETNRKSLNSDKLMETYLNRSTSLFLIVEINNDIVGFIHAINDYIHDLYVKPEYRNKGIGTKLLNSLPKQKYKVTTENKRFYQKNGFKENQFMSKLT
ncbi:MAG: GNAT family N-acetyltransferase [Candidatus Woesearchaeota archaeon]